MWAGPTTVAPLRASPSAISRPSPRPAPVTTATRPVRDGCIVSHSFWLGAGRLPNLGAGRHVAEMRHDLLGEGAQGLLRAGWIDQQHVIDATRFELLQARDDLFGRSEQGGFFAREIGIGVRADILVPLRARSTRQAADRLQHVCP